MVAMLVANGCAVPDRPAQDASPGGGKDLPGVVLDGGDADLATTDDLAEPGDLAGVDLAGVDLAAGKDLAASADLLAAADLMTPFDLYGVDLIACNPPVAGSPCDDSPQCGCAAGLNCSVNNNTTGATACVAAGSTPNGYACTGSGAGQCMVGSSCVDGVCESYCETAADCGGTYHSCDQISNSSGTAIPGFKTCSQLCNPLKPDDATSPFMACGPGIGCLPGATGASSCFGPTKAGGQQGDDCGDLPFPLGSMPDFAKCAPGQLCLTTTVGAISTYTCAKFCRVAMGAADCAGLNNVDMGTTYTCGSFATKQYAGAQEIGVCN
jgi:hypothetical protein